MVGGAQVQGVKRLKALRLSSQSSADGAPNQAAALFGFRARGVEFRAQRVGSRGCKERAPNGHLMQNSDHLRAKILAGAS